MSRLVRTVTLLAIALMAHPTAAAAHAILVESQPPPGGTVRAGALDIRLRYNSRLDKARSRLTLTRPDRTQTIQPIDGAGPPDVLATHAELAPGAYLLRWQVLATDGHITRGDVPFAVAPLAAGPTTSATR